MSTNSKKKKESKNLMLGLNTCPVIFIHVHVHFNYNFTYNNQGPSYAAISKKLDVLVRSQKSLVVIIILLTIPKDYFICYRLAASDTTPC